MRYPILFNYGLVDADTVSDKVQGLDGEGEDIRVSVVDVSEVTEQLRRQELSNGTAITALQHFLLFHYHGFKNT